MNKVVVLCYHRVYPGNHISPEIFDEQMRFVAENLTCVDLDQAVALIQSGEKGNSGASVGVVITFDDGWLDNYVYAYPILRKYGLHATIFVPTAYILESAILRPTLIDYWNGESRYEDLFVGSGLTKPFGDFLTQGKSYEFLSWTELRQMVESGIIRVESHGHYHGYCFTGNRVIGFYDGNLSMGRNIWLSYAFGHAALPGAPIFPMSSALAHPRFLPAQELVSKLTAKWKTLAQSEIPAHSREKILRQFVACWTMENKSGYYESEIDWQLSVMMDLTTAKNTLARQLGKSPIYLGWPFGEYTERAISLARQVGMQACFTTEQGWIDKNSDLLRMNRIGVPRGMKAFRMLFDPSYFKLYLLATRLSNRMPSLARIYRKTVHSLSVYCV